MPTDPRGSVFFFPSDALHTLVASRGVYVYVSQAFVCYHCYHDDNFMFACRCFRQV